MTTEPFNPEHAQKLARDMLVVVQFPVYFTDGGKVLCHHPACDCEGEPISIQIPGRRHMFGCLASAVARHREENGLDVGASGETDGQSACGWCNKSRPY